ncbi:MAG: hypothetical protein GY797_19255 [Deltaproteobacteria bacterium]|nr:hypothetical protein [Deltaproteobacteria bacterium]
MILLPFERFTIQTSLKPKDVRQRLTEVVEPKHAKNRKLSIFSSTDHLPYEGKINDNYFEINRIIHYKNLSLPIIRGEIVSDLDGSSIKITMRLHIQDIVVMVTVIGMMIPLIFLIPFGVEPDGIGIRMLMFIVIAVTPIYLFMIIYFQIEVFISKRFFRNLFNPHSATQS